MLVPFPFRAATWSTGSVMSVVDEAHTGAVLRVRVTTYFGMFSNIVLNGLSGWVGQYSPSC